MHPVRIRNLSFIYHGGDCKALDEVDLDLHEGEMVALMGRTGAGKSTLCRCLNGIIPMFQKGELSGDVQIFSESTRDKRIYELAQNVGLVFQDFESQLFSTSVELEVAFGPENLALPRNEIASRVKYALRVVGLEGFENRQPYNLSGGEKQRLAIASVLSSKPKIMVLDEPTTDLDPQGRYSIFSALRNLKSESISLLIVEQDVEDVMDADRVVIMDNGRIVVAGKTQEIFRDVRLLEEHGIRPPQVAKLFTEIAGDSFPLMAEEAYESRGAELNSLISEQKYEVLKNRQKESIRDVAIEIKGLRHAYPGMGDVLTGVDLTIREGEFIAIIGQNGSGKTTLVKHLNGLLRPSAGSVLCFGKDTAKMSISELGRRVGYVFQNPDHQIFASSVKDEVTFGPRNYGLSEEEISTNVAQALDAVHLNGYEERDPFSLTKGERQRVAVASVLACKPKVLILDEPTTGLDYLQQKSMMELLQSLNTAGHTIIIITHSLWVVAEYAHRVVVMHNGTVVMDGTVREVFSRQNELESIGLRLPEIVKLGNMLGKTLLSVSDYRYVTEK